VEVWEGLVYYWVFHFAFRQIHPNLNRELFTAQTDQRSLPQSSRQQAQSADVSVSGQPNVVVETPKAMVTEKPSKAKKKAKKKATRKIQG